MRLLLVNREREDSLPLTWRALQQHVVDCSDPTTLVVWERNRVHLFAPERGRGIKNWRARNEVRLKHKVNSCCAKDEKSGGKVGGRNNECGLMQWCLEMNEDWGKGRDWTWLDEKITIELTWVSAWAASAAKRRIRREFRPGGNLARFWPPKPPTSILQILSQHIPLLLNFSSFSVRTRPGNAIVRRRQFLAQVSCNVWSIDIHWTHFCQLQASKVLIWISEKEAQETFFWLY